MKLVGIDVDGVIADLWTPWIARYNRDYNDNLQNHTVTSFGTHKFVKPECGHKIYDYLTAPDLYDDVLPLPNARAGVDIIRGLGYEVCFVTSCTYGMTDPKARWLERYGFVEKRDGNGLPPEMIGTYTKRFIDADILIDDRGDTIKEWVVQKRRTAIMVEYPHNRDLDLTSMDWQRVYRAPAYPDLATAWPAIIEHMERLA